ncbi:MAG TPA: hypothetical protein VFT79_04885 [Solirubrobacterales bacterium]|nr:hypothetical protein [Solirubrobacterales bacterium]
MDPRFFSTPVAVLLLLLALLSGTAAAATRPPFGTPSFLTQQVSGAHFVIHFTETGGSAADRYSTANANALLGHAETAYANLVTQWGYPPPANDGDGRTDVYVFDLPPTLGAAAAASDDNADQTTGFVYVDAGSLLSVYPIAHELFHVIQFGVYRHAGFFSESTAEWAGQAVVAATGGSPPPNWYPYPEVSLDCLVPSCGGFGGYHGSIFWEYLAERFGIGIAREAYLRDAALAALAGDHQPHDMQALGETLALHGSSIAAAFNGYALAAVAGQITRPGVLPKAPAADHAYVINQPFIFAPDPVSVNHLALKRIAYLGAAPGSAAPCEAATLSIAVDLPAGVSAQPFFVLYPPSGQPPASAVIPLAISGGTASAAVPWSTCAATIGSLTLPNASANVDGAVFNVRLTMARPVPGGDEGTRLKPLRLSGKRRQDVDKLTVRVRSVEAVTVSAEATVKIPRQRGTLRSKPARAKIAANGTRTLRLRFAPKRLAKIKAALRSGAKLSARIRARARGTAGTADTAAMTVRLKP